jgi:hypothetical protein
LKRAARQSFDAGDSATATEHLQASQAFARAEHNRNLSWRGRYEFSRRLSEVAHEYLRAGQLNDAMRVLGEAADLGVPLRDGFENGLASAVGGMHRRLVQLDVEERFELLREWSLPTETRHSVRVLETLVPTDAPPSDFAKVLGERPRATSFPKASVSGVTGLFSSAWELARAADEAGQMRRFVAELEQLADDGAVNADHVLMLARILAATRRDEELEANVAEHLSRLSAEKQMSATGLPYAGAWQYGYGKFEDGKVTEFTHFPYWTGGAWQFTKDRPDKRHGFIRLDRTGGHPGWKIDCIRRWTAPSKGTVKVSGTLQHPSKQGDGVLGRIVSSSSGVHGEWIVFDDLQDTDVASIKVEAGDTIDFVVNKIGATTCDSCIWLCELRLDTGEKRLTYNSATDFVGPHEANTLSGMVIAAACLEHDWLQPIAERLLEKLVENTYDSDSWMNRPDAVDSPLLRPALRRAWAKAVTRRSGRESKLLDDPGLLAWVATHGNSSAEHAAGYAKPAWLAHESRVMHLAGSQGNSLMFRYPLTGKFAFSLDTQAGGRPGTDGGVAYGGLSYLVDGCEQTLKISDSRDQIDRPCPHVRVRGRTGGRHAGQAQFNRLALSVSDKQVSVLSNGEPVWSGEQSPVTSPWLGLHAIGDRMPVFLGLEITGNPVVPREVRMSDGDSLAGWSTVFGTDRLPRVLPEEDGQENDGARILKEGAVDETNPNHFVPSILATHILAHPLPSDRIGGSPIDASGAEIDHDWFAKDGMIHGARREQEGGPPSPQPSPASGRGGKTVAQSQLRYCRPLLDDESISYEFFYEPGKHEVHPTLGRLAFLIEPGGVRLHWITDGDREWTGLSEDNAVVVPFDRRGPKPLPLVEADWNRMTIAIERGKATLTLNEQLVYQRKLDPQADRNFGLYHDACRSAAQVKNVVMRGDWPERLSADELSKLAAVDESKRSEADRNTLSYLFQEKYLSDSVLEVVRHAASLSDEERYDYLLDWVLPTKSHSSLRLVGRFAPLPVPPLAEQEPLGVASPLEFTTSDENRLQTDVQLIAPAFDLVRIAKKLGRLDDLRERLTSEDNDPRSEAAAQVQAMLTLIAIAADDFATANTNLDALVLALDNGGEANLVDRWPETLAAWMGLRHQVTKEAAGHLIEAMHDQVREGKFGETDVWRHHLGALAAGGRFRAEVDAFGQEVITEPLQQWHTVSHVSARSRGQGFPRSRWQRLPQRVDNVSTHDRDYLYFQSPLRGNFQVECDVASKFGTRESHLAYASTFTSPWNSRSHFGSGSLRERSFGGAATLFEPHLTHPGEWMRYRLKVEDGRMAIYFSGRLVREQMLLDDRDPWLAIRNHWERTGAVRDVRITGEPVIPESIDLLSANLSGWLPYFDESVSTHDADWRFENGELVGRSSLVTRSVSEDPNEVAASLANASGYDSEARERLLHYHRPMLEDGTIEYEFYYEPDETLVHPALDRLAFLFEPNGVRLHWGTHGKYDQTGLDPANAFDDPESRRGPDRLPLAPDEWNKVALKLAGDTVSIALNGQLVFERQLEPTNLRTFGFFHYEDKTKARIRHVVWKGDWPRELPKLSQQELTDVSMVESLAKHAAELPKTISIDFQRQGLPRKLLGLKSSAGANEARDVRATAEGLRLSHDGKAEYNVGTMFGIGGDFDITLSYSDFEANVERGGGAVVKFFLTIGSERRDHIAIKRAQAPNRSNYIQFATSWDEKGGRRWTDDRHADDGDSCIVRFIRRENVVYCLTAEDESSPFRLRDQFEVLPGDLGADGFRVTIGSWAGEATASIVLNKLTIRAERILDNVSELLAATVTPTNATGKARHVRVDLPNKTQTLSLAEVEVFSKDENVAVNKRVTQSSVSWGGVPERAVDGNRSGHFYLAQSTAHTARQADPWWEVDLGESYDIERVLIWNRSDYGSDRLNGCRVQLLDEDRNVVWEHAPPKPLTAQRLNSLAAQLRRDLPERALAFDGKTAHVAVPSLRYDGSHPITFEAVIVSAEGGAILGDAQAGGIALVGGDGKFRTQAWNGTRYATVSSDGEIVFSRIHVAAVLDGDKLTLFVNGRPQDGVGRIAKGAFRPSKFPFVIGATPSPNALGIDTPFAGVIESVRISKTARYTKTFVASFDLESDDDTLTLLKFDQGEGELVEDLSDNGNDGIIRGAEWVTASVIRQRAATSLSEHGLIVAPLLVDAMRDEKPEVRIAAAAGLGNMGRAGLFADALKTAETDPDERVRDAVKKALKQVESSIELEYRK